MSRLVCYSISRPASERFMDVLVGQLHQSVTSLRAYNPTIDAVVFVYDFASADLARLEGLDLRVVRAGSYGELLRQYVGDGAQILQHYPLLHRFLTLSLLEGEGYSQVLLVDCDTVFLGDVAVIFERYNDAQIYGRAEIGSPESDYQDTEYLDYRAFNALMRQLGGRELPLLNCGVLLFTASAVRVLSASMEQFVVYAWRLLLWIAHHSPEISRLEVGLLRQSLPSRGFPFDLTPLPFPSSNTWILDEIALTLALGTGSQIRLGAFESEDVALGIEVFERRRTDSDWIIGHFFSRNTSHARAWWTGDVKPLVAPSVASPAPDPLTSAMMSCSFMRTHRGFAVYEGILTPYELGELQAEALNNFWQGNEESLRYRAGNDGRSGHPARQYVVAGGGPAQRRIYQSSAIQRFLTELCGVPIIPTGERGTFGYYTRRGDYIDLHLDIDGCDLVVITALHDDSAPDDVGGSVGMYPEHIGAPLASIRQNLTIGQHLLKLAVGQSLVMMGGLLPHRILPVGEGHRRVISALCFRMVVDL